MRGWLRRVWCVLRNGHHLFVGHRAPDRFAERCYLCGHVTPGWEVKPRERPIEPPRARPSRVIRRFGTK